MISPAHSGNWLLGVGPTSSSRPPVRCGRGRGTTRWSIFQIKRRAGEGAVVVREDDVRQPPADGRVNVDPSFLTLALLLAVAGASAAIAAPTAPAHQCSDPCLQAARDA